MPGYRPPSTEPRGKWARAIHAKRRAEGLSQTAAFEVLGPLLGLGAKSRAAYVAIDLGQRQPTEAEQIVLADWLGGYPTEDMAGEASATPFASPAALIQALTEQTAAINRLVDWLAGNRELLSQSGDLDAIVAEGIARGRVPADADPSPRERSRRPSRPAIEVGRP